MKKVIITGATSFIGRYLLMDLLKREYEVYACVRPNSSRYNILVDILLKNPNLKIIEVDMENINDLTTLLEKGVYDSFYHLAWEGTRLPERDNDFLQKKNYENTIAAINVSQLLGCNTFIGIGSQAEYGANTGKTDENMEPSPDSQYGIYKLKSFEYADKFTKKNGIRLIWARVFSLYGVHDYQNSLVMSITRKMMNNEIISLTQCIQRWDYMHVKDAVRAIIKLAELEHACGIYNIASGISKPLKEYIEIIKEITESQSTLKYGEIAYQNDVMIELCPLVSKLKKVVDLSDQITFRNGIKEIYDYLKDGVL